MEFQKVLPCYREAFLRLFYPGFCASCNRLLELQERGLCLSCRERLQKLKLLPSEERIRVSLSHGDEGWALFCYQDAVKEIFHKIKFERRRDLLRLFLEEIALFFVRRPRLAIYDCVVPIPLDARRRLEREFNQSGIIAAAVRKILRKKQAAPLPRFEKRVLLKTRTTLPQSLLGREDRKLNLDRVFQVSDPARIRGKSVLLVDDIFTTGSTLEQAAKTMKAAGASRVDYFVLARTLAPAKTHSGFPPPKTADPPIRVAGAATSGGN